MKDEMKLRSRHEEIIAETKLSSSCLEKLVTRARALTDHQGKSLFPPCTEFLTQCNPEQQQTMRKNQLDKRIKEFADNLRRQR